MPIIKVILFDLGNVVLDLDIEGSFQKLGIQEDWQYFSKHPLHLAFEKGMMSEEDFIAKVIAGFGLKLSDNEFVSAWNSMIRGTLTGIVPLLDSIPPHIQVHALTNTNSLHMSHYLQFPGFERFDGFFASHKMACRKPEEEIYSRVMEQLGLLPEEILFFDDLEENIQVAKQMGFHAYRVFRSPEEIQKILKTHIEV